MATGGICIFPAAGKILYEAWLNSHGDLMPDEILTEAETFETEPEDPEVKKLT